MTWIQQVLWKLEMDYIGHPYYVSGNAIYHALAPKLPYETSKQIRASHGMFVPGEFGLFPEEHSQNGIKPYMGASLADIEAYDDLFLFRHSTNPWLLDSRPCDALNTHDIRMHHQNLAKSHETIFGRSEDAYKDKQTTTWYLHAYLHADDPNVLPIDEILLEELQFGGRRNYGYGMTQLKETQVVDLNAVDYSRLDSASGYRIELITPFVLRSEYPGADDDNVPWWWRIDETGLRRRIEKIVERRESYRLETIDQGQIVRYDGEMPVKTAKNGIVRIGTHRKYGFGEFRMIPI